MIFVIMMFSNLKNNYFFVKARQETVTKILEKLFDLYDSYDSFAKNSPYDESMYYDEDMSCYEAPF